MLIGIASSVATAADEVELIWQDDLQAVAHWAIPILLLTCFCFAVTLLVSWSVNIHQSISVAFLSSDATCGQEDRAI